MAPISHLAHSGPHDSFYEQAVRTMISEGTTELKISWIRAMWTAISSPLIHSLLESTWFGDFHNHVVNLFG